MGKGLENKRVAKMRTYTFINHELVGLQFESGRSTSPLYSLSLDLAESLLVDLRRAIDRVREENERMRGSPS